MSGAKIKVLLVDDSLVVRHLVAAELTKDPALEVLGAAINGLAALTRIPTAKPDVVVLDIEMPELDGLQTLKEIRKSHGSLPVIMFSTLTDHGAAATLEALSLGANDYVAKPGSANNTVGQIAPVCAELGEKIKALCKPARSAGAAPHESKAPAPRTTRPAHSVRGAAGVCEVVVIGVSTGGPNALAQLVQAIPAELQVPMLIAQHMPAVFTRLLAERLAANGAVPVVEAHAGEPVTGGKIWIAPGDYHMVLQRRGGRVEIQTNQAPRENSCRPSVDVLFRSAAETYGARTLAVVMTGMGQDGVKGCEIIRAKGGHVIVQDEATSVVWGMPGLVARADLAEAVVPLPELAGEIMRRVCRPSVERLRAVARGGQ